MMKSTCLLLASLAFANPSPAAQPGPYFADRTLPTEVQAAHEAFLIGDFDRMTVHIKDALLKFPGDPGVQNDLLSLWDQAYELKGYQATKPDWSAPAGVTWMNLSGRTRFRVANGAIDHRIAFSLDHQVGHEVEQARLVRYPNQVIFDLQAGIGESSTDMSDGVPSFWIAENNHALPVQNGLYLLDLKLKGQPVTHGWFLLSHMNAPESPEVSVPALGQTFSSGQPTFQWKNFVSSEYRGHQKRRTRLAVVSRAPGTKSNTWSLDAEPRVDATVGSSPEETGVKSLPKDDYVFQLTYRERRGFGDLAISRDSATFVPFSVK